MAQPTTEENVSGVPRNNDSDDPIITWFESLFQTGGSLSLVFAGFTLSIAANESTKEHSSTSTAICSLLFVLNVLLCSARTLGAALHRPKLSKALAAPGLTAGKALISIVSLVLQPSFLVGVLLFFMDMRAITSTIGYNVTAFTGFAVVLAIGLRGLQLKSNWD